MIIIYKTTCLINNKIYIGQHKIRYPSTLDPWYLGSGKAFQAALKKYGVENFKREILAICSSQKQANIFERKAILELKPEYNIAEGGYGSGWMEEAKKEHPEAYEKRRQALRLRMSGRNHPMFGKKHTPETRQKISKANKGRNVWNKGKLGLKMSEETKQKISKALKGKPKPPFSEEHRRKIGLSSIGRLKGNKLRLGIPPSNKGCYKYNIEFIQKDIIEGRPYLEIQKKYNIKSLATITKYKKLIDNENNYRREKYGE